MSKVGRTAVYAGTFDPMTHGHLDIIKRAAFMFDELIVAVGTARGKQPLFSAEGRVQIIELSCKELGLSNVRALPFEGLIAPWAKGFGAVALVRGIRTVADYTYEAQMAHMNHALDPNLETLLLNTHPEFSHVSSSMAKEIALLGGDTSSLVPPHVAEKLKRKLTVPKDRL